MHQITVKQALLALVFVSVLFGSSIWMLNTALTQERNQKTFVINECQTQISVLSEKFWDAKDNITTCATIANHYKRTMTIRDIYLGELLCGKLGYSDKSTDTIYELNTATKRLQKMVIGQMNKSTYFGQMSLDPEHVDCFVGDMWWPEPIKNTFKVGNDTWKNGVKIEAAPR